MTESHSTDSTHRLSHRVLISITILAMMVGGVLMLGRGGPLGNNDLLAQAAAKGKKVATENPFPNRPPAPSLDGGVGWLNINPGSEINLKDLRGKVVLLDFWTYCCINCMHVLPDLKYLE